MNVWYAAPNSAPGIDPRPPITATLKMRRFRSDSSTVLLRSC